MDRLQVGVHSLFVKSQSCMFGPEEILYPDSGLKLGGMMIRSSFDLDLGLSPLSPFDLPSG